MKKADRQKIFDKYLGHCAYCGWQLESDWQADHAISKNHWYMVSVTDIKAVNCIDNMNPACKACNHYKRSHCIESFGTHIGFRDYMKKFHIRLARLPNKTIRKKTEKTKVYMQAIADRYGIAVDKPFSGIFYFEKQSK